MFWRAFWIISVWVGALIVSLALWAFLIFNIYIICTWIKDWLVG